MRTNRVKQTLTDGGVAFGTMAFEFDSTGLARIAATAGAEFIVFDMEHTGWGIETMRRLLATTGAAEIVPIVRPPGSDYHLLSRPLDMGAMGLMVPMIGGAAQARQIVRSAKYPPVGARGAAFGIAHDDYTGGDVAEKIRGVNENVLLIAQIETADGLAHVEEIAAVEGIDVIWIGQFDLTSSLGIAGQFSHPDYLRAVERVVTTAEKHGKAAGFMALSVDEGAWLLEQGFRALAYSGDLWIYGQALRQGIDGLRQAAQRKDGKAAGR